MLPSGNLVPNLIFHNVQPIRQVPSDHSVSPNRAVPPPFAIDGLLPKRCQVAQRNCRNWDGPFGSLAGTMPVLAVEEKHLVADL